MKKKILLGFLYAFVLFCVCGCVGEKEDPAMIEKYNQAIDTMAKETNSIAATYYKYEDAKKIFDELGDFRDSIEKSNECYKHKITYAIELSKESLNEGDIWSAKNMIPYRLPEMPQEAQDFLDNDIFNLIGDWKFESKGTSLRIDLSSQMGNLDILAKNGSVYSTGYWKIKDNKLLFCNILSDKEVDSNYKELFTIVSYNENQLVIKNSQQSFTLTK